MNPERWRQIENLYHASLGRAPESRGAFLEDACGQDGDLRREVEALLAHGDQAASILETLAPEKAETLTYAVVTGREFGPYRILSPLGAGGMGEVYRAHDRKLGRDVAIKTLPRAFARDPDRLARLRREARTLASLNHPNIAAIYGLEESADADCLVLELVEGETLRGPLPIGKALDYAGQVAQALEAAHSKGIIHRDLKPANVKVTPEGRVKVLDFGLAKAVWGAEEHQDLSQLTTVTVLETVAGRIIGTPPYMSPEQARGKNVDKRTDVWAFGCVLYELLTGKRAFQGETLPDTIAAVLEREPDWQALPAKTPTKVRELLRRCLDKNAESRMQNIADARRTIERAQRGWNGWQVAAIAAAALASLAIAAVLWLRGTARPADRAEWLQITKFPDSVSQPALSADGRMLAFIRGQDTFVAPGEVYVKMLPDGEPVQLTHDNSVKMSPVFSPDGARIAYTRCEANQWDTWVVPVLGGQAHSWLPNASGLAWADSQKLLFSEIKKDIHMAIVSAEETRAGARDIYVPASERGMAHRSYPSPDGNWALVVEMDRGAWLPCRLVPMDAKSPGRQVGPPGAGCTFAAWSPDGKWMYLSSAAGGSFHTWRQRFPDGMPEQITSGPSEEEGISVARDGRSFITSVGQRQSSVWLHDSSGDRQVSLEGYSYDPKFTPDGKRLCYRVLKGASPILDPSELWVTEMDSGRRDPLLPGLPIAGEEGLAYDFSPDGRQLAVAGFDREGKHRLWLAEFDHRLPPRQIPNVEGDTPLFGTNGEIFFRAVERTSAFAYQVREDGTGLRKAIDQPIAGLEGISADRQWLVVRLPSNEGTSLTAFPVRGGSPVRILAAEFGPGDSHAGWSPDGSRMLIFVPEGAMGVLGRTYALPVPAGQAFPRIPTGGFRSEEEIAKVPGVRLIHAFDVAPSPTPDVYAFSRGNVQRNLFRIPIP